MLALLALCIMPRVDIHLLSLADLIRSPTHSAERSPSSRTPQSNNIHFQIIPIRRGYSSIHNHVFMSLHCSVQFSRLVFLSQSMPFLASTSGEMGYHSGSDAPDISRKRPCHTCLFQASCLRILETISHADKPGCWDRKAEPIMSSKNGSMDTEYNT